MSSASDKKAGAAAGSVSFRQAMAADLGQIVSLLYDDELGRTREILSEPVDAAYVSAFNAIMRDPNQLMAVAVDNPGGALVGCLQLTFLPGLSHRGAWRGQIEGVRVAANLRGRGIGRAFIRWAIEACRDRGCQMVQLTSSRSRTEAQRFYGDLGFTASHVGFKLDL